MNFLEGLKCPAYKIASPEITHIPLIERVAKTKKPIILSLGLAKVKDIKLALRVIKKFNNNKVVLLKCVSDYPSLLEDQNLKSILEIKKKFKILTGFSDHTLGFLAPVTSVAIGAKVLEKHFNIKNNKSIDSFFSTDNEQFQEMVQNIRLSESALGNDKININHKLIKNFNSRRSIYVSRNILKGEIFTEKNIKVVRPGYGLHPKYYKNILKKNLK